LRQRLLDEGEDRLAVGVLALVLEHAGGSVILHQCDRTPIRRRFYTQDAQSRALVPRLRTICDLERKVLAIFRILASLRQPLGRIGSKRARFGA
jgi:hypothetical protein